MVETVWGLRVHSMSLLADAGHNLSDVLGLASAWFAQILARRAPSNRFTYGMRRATILSALANAVFLLLVTGGIIWESILRLLTPSAVAGEVVSWVALAGILVNGGTALLFMRGAEDDLNVRGAFLHMASDAVMAFAVVLAGLAIAWTGHTVIDPAVSLLVSLFIIGGTWSLLRGAVTLSLDGVPAGIDIAKVEAALRALPGVQDIHHLHVWPMSTTETALTVHILRDPNNHTITNAHMIDTARAQLRKRFSIGHPTFQIEDAHASCAPTHQNCQKPA
ncbi:cation efflux system protein [Neokomagataea tanensis NBRC 106556]|uniref:Cation efflux system protein n=1 Tax=Neokomagataea tanensis NBRC 106556 TaxID=1223519 RepID=A0ABQ0QLL7_9PROT|nr:cation efflux system protein [Neokomagataea tanensis NBRC 106556]